MSEHVYLCLSELLDQDTTSYEYFHSLPDKMQAVLKNREIFTFQELQDSVAKIKTNPVFRDAAALDF